jgi:hypothetical protein
MNYYLGLCHSQSKWNDVSWQYSMPGCLGLFYHAATHNRKTSTIIGLHFRSKQNVDTFSRCTKPRYSYYITTLNRISIPLVANNTELFIWMHYWCVISLLPSFGVWSLSMPSFQTSLCHSMFKTHFCILIIRNMKLLPSIGAGSLVPIIRNKFLKPHSEQKITFSYMANGWCRYTIHLPSSMTFHLNLFTVLSLEKFQLGHKPWACRIESKWKKNCLSLNFSLLTNQDFEKEIMIDDYVKE